MTGGLAEVVFEMPKVASVSVNWLLLIQISTVHTQHKRLTGLSKALPEPKTDCYEVFMRRYLLSDASISRMDFL